MHAGIEPATHGLLGRCSTVELMRVSPSFLNVRRRVEESNLPACKHRVVEPCGPELRSCPLLD